jgi:hypothetical protein
MESSILQELKEEVSVLKSIVTELREDSLKKTEKIELLELKDFSDRNDIIILYEEAIENLRSECME